MWYCPINKKYTKEAYTMTDKTKRIVLIAVCCLLCIAAAVGIAVRFGGNANISSGVVLRSMVCENRQKSVPYFSKAFFCPP